ncbi:hypothetical protein BDP81DRAFT_113834 [Colletotrichum phormii]|uniref:Uncharacterized protein n=1 Tax=Colletotrichum phormii TaxID=359342 RepID=A0AAJ0EBQ7_9PEZI|nr:uncharacterized protein BDP81DRAFT_113834 [Colletotrichum phormii]KAK1623882.1 hypothetical protein BDP81DRAFT_113834 [Colletotrichum phormii]
MAQMVAIPESAMAGRTHTWQGLVDIGSPVFAGDARRRPPSTVCELQQKSKAGKNRSTGYGHLLHIPAKNIKPSRRQIWAGWQDAIADNLTTRHRHGRNLRQWETTTYNRTQAHRVTRNRNLNTQSLDRQRSIFVSLAHRRPAEGKKRGGRAVHSTQASENMHVRQHATRFKQAVEAVEHGAMLRLEPQEDQCRWNQGTASPARLGALRLLWFPWLPRCRIITLFVVKLSGWREVLRKIGRVPTFPDLGMRRASGPLLVGVRWVGGQARELS